MPFSRTFLFEFPLGSYVQLCSLVAAMLDDRSAPKEQGTFLPVLVPIHLDIPFNKDFAQISHYVICQTN